MRLRPWPGRIRRELTVIWVSVEKHLAVRGALKMKTTKT